MSPRVTILTGTLAGQTRPLGTTRISLGRDPGCEIRFDPRADTEVSARHAELRVEGGRAIIHDANSTNGTYVNDRRISGEQALADGDVIRLGARGPKLRFESAASGAAGPGGTSERVAVAVQRHTRGLRIAVVVLALAVIGGASAIAWSAHREKSARDRELGTLRRRNDSLSAAVDRGMRSIGGRIAGLDSAVAAGRMDYQSIARANGGAVVMIAVEMPDGRSYSGTGFGVSADGAIVTNRHLVQGVRNEVPRRIAVIYADTRDWLPAHIERVAGDADLAVLRVDRPGTYPVVGSISSTAPSVGAPVAVIGYPRGVSTPMEGSGTAVTARTTLGVGTVAKSIPATLQIDAFAMEGSSGSPVFGADGAVVGVVYGGEGEARGRIVYAVPAPAVLALLR